MNKEELLLSRLTAYGKSGQYPFHMPGHKRMVDQGMLKEFPNLFSIDITEIDGFDNLHHPEGILKESMEWAAGVYGADQTFYLVNGSSGGILSAICAMTRAGDHILVSRNCHKSVYHGVILNQLKVSYVYPQIVPDLGIQSGIIPEDVDKLLTENTDIKTVLIVSPTYDGVVSDIEKIAEIVHRHKGILIVDEAHGAHFSFFGGKVFSSGLHFPVSALDCGADLVIQSLHKTLPSMTQTAVLHVREGIVNMDRLKRYLQMFQSSSPSYVFMAGIEGCIYEMAEHGAVYGEVFSERLVRLRRELGQMKHLRLLETAAGVFDLDPSKIVISCRHCVRENRWHGDRPTNRDCLTGEQLSEWLRTEFGLEMEMAGADYVVAITTCMDSEEGLKRLGRAFLEIDRQVEWIDERQVEGQSEGRSEYQSSREMDGQVERRPGKAIPVYDIRMDMWKAMEAETCVMPIREAAGHISAEFIYLYPPGIPIVAPGEWVTEEIAEQVLACKNMGLPVQGMADEKADFLRVIMTNKAMDHDR